MDETRENRGPAEWTQTVVRNKDIPTLTRVLYAMQDVSATERKRMWQQDRLWNMTAKITGMPGGGGNPKGMEENFAAISELEEKYQAECAEYLAELKEAEEILNSIRNRKARTFVCMKYVMDMGRGAIMRELNLKRWQYARMSEAIEIAEDMAHVEWKERYLLQNY